MLNYRNYRGRGEYGVEVNVEYNRWQEFGADNDEQAKPENSGFAEVVNIETGKDIK